jgi:MFS family permease
MASIFAILIVVTACGGVIFNSTTVAMPKVFDERLRELTQTNLGIGALVAFVYSVAAFAQVVVGSLIDRVDMRRLMIAMALAQIPLLALAANSQGWVMLAAAILMMLAVFGQIPLNDAIVGRYCSDEYRSRVYAVRYVITFTVAAVAVPLISALHATAGGFRNVFLVLACLALAILAAALFFPSRRALARQAAPA